MPPRLIFRIVLSLAIIALVWTRALRHWRFESKLWLVGSITISVILLAVVFVELLSVRQRMRRSREEAPKHPLGLE